MPYAPVEPELRWLGSRRLWITVLVAVAVAALSARSSAVAARRAVGQAGHGLVAADLEVGEGVAARALADGRR